MQKLTSYFETIAAGQYLEESEREALYEAHPFLSLFLVDMLFLETLTKADVSNLLPAL